MSKWAQALRTALLAVILVIVFLLWGYMNFAKGYVIGLGYSKQRTGVLLETRGREVENWTLRYRNEPQ